MPYIKKERRERLDIAVDELAISLRVLHWCAGDLNYCLFRLMKLLFIGRPCYQTLNDFAGVLANCWPEFYRRVGVPYEKEKIKENGDVK